WSWVEPLAGRLPSQAVHGDVTDDNVVCLLERGLRTPDGIIDFGDLTSSWAVGELAVAITSVLRHAGAEPCSVLPAVRAFRDLRPLDLGHCAVLDLSAQSDAVDEGAWLEPGQEDRLAAALLAEGYDAVTTRFGEARLTGSRVLAGVSPATVATGIDLWTAAPV